MPAMNPEATVIRKGGPEDDESKTRTLEEEIVRMEKYRRELVKKMGGAKYKEVLDGLVRKKQQKYYRSTYRNIE